MPLTDRDRALLDFAARWYRYPGAQEQAMRDELGLSATRYWQAVNGLLDRPEALAYAPVTVQRLKRVRRDRSRERRRAGGTAWWSSTPCSVRPS